MNVNVNKSSNSRVRIKKEGAIDKVDGREEKDKDDEAIRGKSGGRTSGWV